MFFKKKKQPNLITIKELLVLRDKGHNIVLKNGRLYCRLKEQ